MSQKMMSDQSKRKSIFQMTHIDKLHDTITNKPYYDRFFQPVRNRNWRVCGVEH